MGIWGIEVKPGKPYPFHSDKVRGRLQITQATLGLGSSTGRSILQCTLGHKPPIFLCSLSPNKNECCPLDLVIDEDDDVVAFSVIGPLSIHLSGYFVPDEGDDLHDEYDPDSYGEDIAETESEESSEYDTEDDYGDDFIDDDDEDSEDLDIFQSSTVPKSRVVIEEITEDEKPANENLSSKGMKKRNQPSDSEDKNKSHGQLVVKRSAGAPVLESEDEDGFPVSADKRKGAMKETQEDRSDQGDKMTTKEEDTGNASEKKRKINGGDEDGQLERKKKKKKKQKQKEKGAINSISDSLEKEVQPEESKPDQSNQVSPTGNEHDQKLSNDKVHGIDADSMPGEKPSEKKKKKKKNKSQESEGCTNTNQTVSASGDKSTSLKSEQGQTALKSPQVRTFPNGLVIEEVAMGKPDGKRASRGKQVTVHYIGKLKKNGKIFDSNVGRAPFKFRLGVGQVIKGWDVGVEGMRVGDKRKLIIPPAMGYGSRGAGKTIPPNSWLEFDVELLDVR